MTSKTFKKWDADNVQTPREDRVRRNAAVSINSCGRVTLNRRLTQNLGLKAGDRISFVQGIEEPREMFLYKVKDKSEAGITLKADQSSTYFFGTAFGKAMAETGGVEMPLSFRVSNVAEVSGVKGMPAIVFRCYINEIKSTKKQKK